MEYTSNYQLRKPVIGVDQADVRDLNRNMDTIDAIMNASQNSLAPAYDTSEEYNTGDVVMYEMLMYECLEDEVTGVWDATKWQRTTAGQHGGGSDVSITPTLQSGTKIAEYEVDGVQGELYAPTGGGGGGNLSDLGDVNITTPSDGQALIYDATNQEWVNGSGGGEGGSSGGVYIEETLWEGSETPRYPNSYTATLPHSIKDYDFLVFDAIETDNNSHIQWIIHPKNVVYDNVYYTQISDNDSGFVITFLSDTSVNFEAYHSSHATTYTKIVGIKVSGNYFAPQIYSLEEREVGVWIDGKPLYQKSYDLSDIRASDFNWSNNILGTVGSGIEIFDYQGNFICWGSAFPYYYFRSTSEYWTSMINNTLDDINIRPNLNAGGSVIYLGIITILYTKTTDTAGSGSWTPSGVPAHHYSTDEQVVGTWIDGSTIYEKTITLSNITIPANSTQTWQLSNLIVNINICILKQCILNANNTWSNVPTSFANNDYQQYNIGASISEGQLILSRGSANSITGDFYVTIQYTKSS